MIVCLLENLDQTVTIFRCFSTQGAEVAFSLVFEGNAAEKAFFRLAMLCRILVGMIAKTSNASFHFHPHYILHCLLDFVILIARVSCSNRRFVLRLFRAHSLIISGISGASSRRFRFLDFYGVLGDGFQCLFTSQLFPLQ